MTETEFVENASALTAVFGEWPSFHDSEVLTMRLDRAGEFGPTLDASVHVFRMTDVVDRAGFFVLTHHTRVTLRFGDIILPELKWFNAQNALSELSIEAAAPDSNTDGRRFHVRFDSAWGVDAELFCNHVAVVSVEPFAPAS